MDDKSLDTLEFDDDCHEDILTDNAVKKAEEEITPILIDFAFEDDEQKEKLSKEVTKDSFESKDLDLKLSFEDEFNDKIEDAVKEVELKASNLLEENKASKEKEVEKDINEEEEKDSGLSFELSKEEQQENITKVNPSEELEIKEGEPEAKEEINFELSENTEVEIKEDEIKEVLELNDNDTVKESKNIETVENQVKAEVKKTTKNKVKIEAFDLDSFDIEDLSQDLEVLNIEDYYLPEKKKKLPLDFIVYVISGALVLFLVNFYFFSSETQPVTQNTPVFSEILKEVKAKKKDHILDKEIIVAEHSMSFKDEFGKYNFNLSFKNELLHLMNFEFIFNEPQSLTDEEIVQGLSLKPWIKKIILEKMSFVHNKTGSVVGVGKIKAYIVYKNKQKRSILDVQVTGKYNNGGVNLLLTLSNDLSFFTAKKDGLIVKLDELDNVKFRFIKPFDFIIK